MFNKKNPMRYFSGSTFVRLPLYKLAAGGTPVLGVCGGYQMLGETLADPEGTESGTAQTVRGLGLLPTHTVFTGQKHRTQDTAAVIAAPFAGAELEGYEIHTGVTEAEGEPFAHYPSDAALIPMEEYRRQQFDILADGVRGALDMDAVYAAMGMERR